jgi:hypothetical protein
LGVISFDDSAPSGLDDFFLIAGLLGVQLRYTTATYYATAATAETH